MQAQANTPGGLMKVVKYAFIAIGILMLVAAAWWYTSVQAFLEKAVETQGTVIRLRLSEDMDSTGYKPVVEFTTLTSETIQFVSTVATNPPSYKVGDRVQVLYDASSPYEARIKSFFALWGGVSIVGGIGVIFLGVGIVFMLLQRSGKNFGEAGGGLDME